MVKVTSKDSGRVRVIVKKAGKGMVKVREGVRIIRRGQVRRVESMGYWYAIIAGVWDIRPIIVHRQVRVRDDVFRR